MNFFKKKIDLFIGVFLGGMIAITVYYFFAVPKFKISPPEKTEYIRHAKAKIDTVKFGSYTLEIKERTEIEVKEKNEILEEKIKSFDDRVTDFRTLLGFIITLLLAIIGGFYLKTEAEIEKHMNANYETYKKKIEGILAQATTLLSQIETQAKLAEQTAAQNKQGNQDTPAATEESPSDETTTR